MTDHDVYGEGSELSELRELHRQDRMPADVRERLLRYLQKRSSRARAVGLGLGASALAAAVALAIVGARGGYFGAGPEHVTLESETTNEPARESRLPKPAGDPTRAELRVVGWLIPNSGRRLPVGSASQGDCRYGFQLSPLSTTTNAVLRVEYPQCRLPKAMIEAEGCVKVTAQGYIEADGHLEASWIMAEGVHCQP